MAPCLPTQVESAQERLLFLARLVLSPGPLIPWLSSQGGTNMPTLTMLQLPVKDTCQQEHLDALPGWQGQQLPGVLGAHGERTHKRAS